MSFFVDELKSLINPLIALLTQSVLFDKRIDIALISETRFTKQSYLSIPGPTYWPTSIRKKPDILNIFVTKIPSNLYYSINNILDLNSDYSSVILNIVATPQTRTVAPKLFTASTNRLKFHNIIAEEINLNISFKSVQEIDDAVNNLTTLIQSAASMSNTLNTTNNHRKVYNKSHPALI
ncbi:Hypothetical protein CINCED_3A011192 [Cinara cedri]|uniref:Uncharacterized protein n=1 Tax=Cinara cedri TaxID=506608 RepID=A0A5E4MME7_9HEMI|nr:Hypothetical protein CINCED_3A011192 [Cinara cedri]